MIFKGSNGSIIIRPRVRNLKQWLACHHNKKGILINVAGRFPSRDAAIFAADLMYRDLVK